MFRLIHQLIPRVKRVIIALMTWRVVEWVDHMASARRPRGVKQEGGVGMTERERRSNEGPSVRDWVSQPVGPRSTHC